SETDEAHHGQTGLEAYYDRELQGSDGMRVWEEDARGGARRVVDLKEPQEGATMMLTIDAELHKASYEILQRHLKALGLKRAALVVVDPSNGEILALLSAPGYSPEALAQGLSDEEFRKLRDDPSHPFFIRAVSGLYPPGSTIKPFLAAAALAERIIDPKKQIMVTGAIEVVNLFNPDVRYTFPDWKAHGLVDMVRAIAVSSNVYFYTIGGGYDNQKGLGIERVEKYLKRFGFGAQTEIDLPGEAVGRVPTPDWKKRVKGEDWYIGDTYHAAIGQGDVVVTPLQLALATAALANNGTLFKPHLVRRIDNESARPENAASLVAKEEYLAVPRQGMRHSVLEGSSQLLNDLPIAVAGKTGTAQTGRGTMHAWFTSFAPYENPEIVLTVVVEEGGEGNAVAVPIAKDIYKWYIEHRLNHESRSTNNE
ncbi:MAG: penicillin-binding transpeptidase domain-containing protein, partial [Patescibacteria group bacterium]|nr:penicillin-binding transpeptidase domain-containing protein [Patescibacteria group bacterium]